MVHTVVLYMTLYSIVHVIPFCRILHDPGGPMRLREPNRCRHRPARPPNDARRPPSLLPYPTGSVPGRMGPPSGPRSIQELTCRFGTSEILGGNAPTVVLSGVEQVRLATPT